MGKSTDQIVGPVTLKYAVALGLLAILAAANFLILRASISESAGLARIVNQAGRQRMLLHRAASFSDQLVFTVDEDHRAHVRSELRGNTHELDATHHELMQPDEARRLGVSQEILAIYEDAPWLLDSEMRNYLMHLRSLTNADLDELVEGNPHFAYVSNPETIDRIRDGLEAIVDVYEAHSEAKTTQLNLLAFWSFASTLILLLLDGWFVFRPMARQVRADVVQLNELNDTLEQRVADRTAMAEQRAEWLAQSEAALRESEELYSSLAGHLPMSVLRKDREGHFLFANEQFCRLVDQPLQSIVGKTDADFYPTELAERYRADDCRVMESGQVFQGIEEHQTRDGRALFVEVLKVPLRDAQGFLIGTQTMFWDVTQRHDAEQRALQAERLAAIGQVVTGVAHESRNALQQIQACSQMLKWELDGDEAKQELLTDLQKAEERLVRLFDELRSYAAPLKLDRRMCDLRKIVADAWESIDSQRNGRDATLAEARGNSAAGCVVDPFQMEQVFRNLFENALAACNDPVQIDVAYDRHEDVDGSQLSVTVSDNGPGLNAEQHARVFEAFFTTKTQGTGLGLSIARRIVEAHGGQICPKLTGTKGAVFEMKVPVKWSPPNQSMEPEQDEARTT